MGVQGAIFQKSPLVASGKKILLTRSIQTFETHIIIFETPVILMNKSNVILSHIMGVRSGGRIGGGSGGLVQVCREEAKKEEGGPWKIDKIIYKINKE